MVDRPRRRAVAQVVGGMVAAASLGIGAGAALADGPVSTLAAPEAHSRALAGELLLIDIRRPEEWAATGSAEGAVRLDMRRPDFGQEVIRLIEGDPTRPVALICARGNRSAWLSDRMAEAGFQAVIDVSEGMLGSEDGPGWLARGLPVSQ